MLELDIGVTKDNQVIVMHDTTVDRVTNGTGTVASKTLKQIQRLDGAYWFTRQGTNHYKHGLRTKAYPFRGVATGKVKPPKGYAATDFRVTTLAEVLKAFPHTPINIEIKGRTKAETDAEYVQNAEVLAKLLGKATGKSRLIVVSFHQPAVDRFHTLVPSIGVAPGVGGDAAWLLNGMSPGDGVVAFQVPITYKLGDTLINVTTPDTVARAHREGYAWQVWFSDQDVDGPASWRTLIAECADGVMTAKPVAFEKVLRANPAPASCTA
jgi:glycerophosphoryl diester phosphodiesterase